MNNLESLWILLAKKLDEELTNEEAASLVRIIDHSPQFKIVLQRLNELFSSLKENNKADTLNAYVQLCRKIASRPNFLSTSDKYFPYFFSKN